MGKTNKQWRLDGDEDKFIVRLIKEGKINKFTKPSSLQKDYPKMFANFSDGVVRNHLNVLRRSNGVYLDNPTEVDEEDLLLGRTNIVDTDPTMKEVSANSTLTAGIQHINYPFFCETYVEPETQITMVIDVVNVPSGAQNIRLDVSSDGIEATLKYKWPNVMFSMADLFHNPLSNNQITLHHPKIIALNSGLQNVRNRIDSVPESEIKISLPIKVQTSSESWTKKGVSRYDGSQIIVAEFKGYVKDYNKTLADASVQFEE